ncbi:MAG TPA: histidine--tRNA ligase [Ferruginibacter sp.]|nr:histidine--tRNA ligase [Ferruginibacter sp.]
MSKPSIPQGTRDFSAEVVRKRNYILSTIKNVFELYGFQPLETPAMENLNTLMGKYGEEGDRLIFKIINNGINDPKNIDKAKAGFEKVLEGKSSTDLTERALKYDLTIPFARYVAMNHTQLTFPFKRYQIQPVWRADRPQKGRYREFTQCDADVVGSTSLLNEVELINIYDNVFKKLEINVLVKINNRKILQGIAEYCGCPNKLVEITTAIDKLDKIGREKVSLELAEKGIPQDKIENIFDCIFIEEKDQVFYTAIQLEEEFNLSERSIKQMLKTQDSIYRKHIGILNCLRGWFSNFETLTPVEIGIQGVNELIEIFEYLVEIKANISVEFDTTLARGLNYYTGTIIEVKAPAEVKMGSIGGGGRYDDLTGLFDVPGIPGVGISFGVDRIYDVMEELKLFPENLQVSTKALFFNMGEAESLFAFGIMQQLRGKGIACELYHEFTKIGKQFTYAEKKNIPYAVIIGSKEMEENNCVVKNLATGVQNTVALDKLFNEIAN